MVKERHQLIHVEHKVLSSGQRNFRGSAKLTSLRAARDPGRLGK